MTAAEIIDKFGGQSALAKLLNKRQSTIQHWYNNRIPAKWQKAILDLAEQNGISLKADDFMEDVPRATHDGELKIGDIIIPCAVLEEGTRLLTQQGFLKAMGRARAAKGGHGASVAKIPAFLAASNLKPFISEELIVSTTPIRFRSRRGILGYGYRADLLPKVCDVYLQARDKDVLARTQEHIARQADVLMRGLAHVGIVALVDEATGYQEVRDRIALQEILDQFLTDEWAKWTRTFPNDYYKELFRLNKMPYPPTRTRLPQFIGHWTNDIVYSRLAPGVKKELKKKNPVLPAGYRKRRHHQYLTRDYGHPALKEHLSNIIFLMKTCLNWKEFKRKLDLASPKYGDTMQLPFPEKENQ